MNEPTSVTSKAGSFWAWVPALLLGSMFIGLGTLAYVAIDDPNFALEPNYFDKAIHWVQSQADARASRAMGLKLTLAPLVVASNGQVSLTLTIADRANLPLLGAAVQVEAFPNAFASRIETLTLRETAPGVYTGQLAHGLSGLWELRVALQHGATTYHEVLRRDVTKGAKA